jgi:hypothetical protein
VGVAVGADGDAVVVVAGAPHRAGPLEEGGVVGGEVGLARDALGLHGADVVALDRGAHARGLPGGEGGGGEGDGGGEQLADVGGAGGEGALGAAGG